MAIPKSAHYRPSTTESRECGRCKWITQYNERTNRGKCRMYGMTVVSAEYVCDNFEARPDGKDVDPRER